MAQHRDVVVVGGGQAGLAIGYFLAGRTRNFTPARPPATRIASTRIGELA